MAAVVTRKTESTFDITGLDEKQARELIDILGHYSNSVALKDIYEHLHIAYQKALKLKRD